MSAAVTLGGDTAAATCLDALVGVNGNLQARLDPPTETQKAEWASQAERIIVTLGSRPRGGCAPARWRTLLADVRSFIEAGWLHRAHALGWYILELLGCDRVAPFARYDHMALVLLLSGGRMSGLTNIVAIIETLSGGRLTHRRVPLDRERVVLIDQIGTNQ
jgi:hypothetical protein